MFSRGIYGVVDIWIPILQLYVSSLHTKLSPDFHSYLNTYIKITVVMVTYYNEVRYELLLPKNSGFQGAYFTQCFIVASRPVRLSFCGTHCLVGRVSGRCR